MSKFAAEHADALSDLVEAGSAVTFTHTSPGTYNSTTDTWSGAATTTVAGYAIRVTGEPERYKSLELIESEAPTLLFTPNTYGSLPSLNDTVTWNSTVYAVRDIQPLAPDGTAILARVIVAR